MTPGRARSILLVAHGAPPSTKPGARRIAGLTRYLADLGHEVTVLTSIMFGRGGGEWGARRIVRTRDAIASPALERRRRWNRRAGVDASPAGAGLPDADGGYGVPESELHTNRLTSLFVPDVAVATWLPFALPRAVGLALTHRYDCVITSAPPRSTHLIGLALSARGLPWIADFRDGWTFEAVRPSLSKPAAALDRKLEQLVASRAEVVTAVTPSLTEDLRTRLAANAVTVTNGFDPAELDTAPPRHRYLLAPDRHSLLYTGSLHPNQLAPFARALTDVLRDRPDWRSRLEIVVIGPRWEGVKEIAEREALDCVRWVPPLPRDEVLRLQRHADSLLVLLDPERPGVATTKLYEYISADRPVLIVGADGDAARVLADAGAGFSVPATPAGVTSGLELLLHGESPPHGGEGRDAYAYPRVAAQMAEQVEAAIARRRGRDRRLACRN